MEFAYVLVIYRKYLRLFHELFWNSVVNVLFHQQWRPIKVIGTFKVLRELLSRPIGEP